MTKIIALIKLCPTTLSLISIIIYNSIARYHNRFRYLTSRSLHFRGLCRFFNSFRRRRRRRIQRNNSNLRPTLSFFRHRRSTIFQISIIVIVLLVRLRRTEDRRPNGGEKALLLGGVGQRDGFHLVE
uniref:(northern house mosquito) hypothetical protein n=1 Tax=Culex pipiens TaxID=7175 RepID=A0A8D8C9Y8_CULPI